MSNCAAAAGGVVYGAREIAAFLGVKPRQVFHLINTDRLPIFREGRVVCSTRSALNSWVAERDAAARKTPANA